MTPGERKEQVEARLKAIAKEADTDSADIDALTEEVRGLKEELEGIEEGAKKRAELRKAIANGELGVEVRRFEERKPENAYGVDTEEYRTAWLKALRKQSLSDVEKRAFTTANGAISQLVANDIMSVVRDHAPLMERMTMVYSAAKITYYVEGTTAAAADHTENAAITAAADTLTAVELSPAEIVKMIQVSQSAKDMSIPAFNTWLTQNLGRAIAVAINKKIVAAISATTNSAGTSITAATVQALLGSVKGEGIAVLCNRKTLYTKLLPLQDNSKNAMVRFEGTYDGARIYGVDILVDDNVADDTVLAGDMRKVIGAMAEDINVREAYDIDTNSNKYLGAAVFDVKVGVAAAFAKIAPAA